MAKSYRKFIAGAATAAVVGSAFAGVAGAASFSDVDSSTTHQEGILALVDAGVIKGYEDGTFRPYAQITRGEAAIMVARAIGILDGKNIPANPFKDVSENQVAYEAIVKLADRGIVSGFTSDTFKPYDKVTRAQVAKYVALAYGYEPADGITKFPDVNENAALAAYVDVLADAGIIQGKANGNFGYNDALRRADFSGIVFRAEEAKKKPDEKPVVKNPITLEAADNKGNKLKNGEKKTFTATITNPVSGKPVPNAAVNVTFAENIGTDAGSKRNVVVTDAYGNEEGIPYQADLEDGAVESVVIFTDQHGKATFTISGSNASVTPIVFLDGTNQEWDTKSGILDEILSYKDGRFDKNVEFYAEAKTVSFNLESYDLSVSAKGTKFAALAEGDWDEEKATHERPNGREYTVTVLKEDGKPFAGGTVNVGINELLDQEPGNDPSKSYLVGANKKGIVTLKLDSEGKGKVVLASTADNDFASPIFWLDENGNNVPNTFESSIVGELTNFQLARVQAEAKLDVKDSGLRENVKDFEFIILNQSGQEFGDEWYEDKDAQATFEVKNTGSHAVRVIDRDGTEKYRIEPNKVLSIPVEDVENDRTLRVRAIDGPSSVEVSANAVIKWYEEGRSRNVAVTAPTKSADLQYSVDVEDINSEFKLLSVTPEDKNNNGTPEYFVFTFNKAVSGAEEGDFRLGGKPNKAATAVELRDGDKEVVVKFAESLVGSESTISYDGGYVNANEVITDGYGNTARPFSVEY
ncbi:S-layer homology domain-containing protein [Bacillus tuaregi]|uniref:S-layer homology domain-containing protein n=1 Tax=Bacillus tuaregi TaxID=1816695 RepID=UPI0008F919B7|nr:S-layer homology domain-containing protein [Bacillus tuaregi]